MTRKNYILYLFAIQYAFIIIIFLGIQQLMEMGYQPPFDESTMQNIFAVISLLFVGYCYLKYDLFKSKIKKFDETEVIEVSILAIIFDALSRATWTSLGKPGGKSGGGGASAKW